MSDYDIETRSQGDKTWWEQQNRIEKIGFIALGVAVAAGVGAFVFPHLAAASAGGALTGAGAFLLRKGFGSRS
ncbi:MAG TPA: hypothetical protein VFE30_04325 [Anaeromyxobacteraceae bacterium]|jgi:hypothetical protein|nr:hypothetical protein [Anaeromyxobacteraceae bacterium]